MTTATMTEAKWAARVESWRRSGESATAFAEGQEFSASALRYWKSRLHRLARAGNDVRIARVVRTGPDATVMDTPIVVELGHARIGIRRGFDAETLRGVLDVLGRLKEAR
jgi:hypothetical protein